jgi:ubiquinone/menaquinone biosynthesis C-methylase UbiE
VRGEAGALPLQTGSTDLVVSASSLHDWPDAAAGLREIRRVLRPGGRVVVLDWCAEHRPIRWMEGWLRVTRRPVARVLTRGELAGAMRAAGFEVGAIERASISPVWGMMVAQGVAVDVNPGPD